MTDELIIGLASKHADIHTDGRGRIYYEFDTHGLLEFTRLIAAQQKQKDAKICTSQRYMVLQPTRTYTAYDICDAQKRAAEHLARAILAQGD